MHQPRHVARSCLAIVLLLAAAATALAGLDLEYLQSVRLWAAGRRVDALEELRLLHASRGRRAYWGDAAEDLGKDDPRVLVPLLAIQEQLHAVELFRWATEQRRDDREAASSSLDLFRRLAWTYLSRTRRGQSEKTYSEARQIVSSFWCCVAIRYRRIGLLGDAAGALRRAINADESNTPAIHALAAIQEKQGEYLNAAATLQDLLEQRPDAAEPQLRRALCLLRTSRQEEGAAILRSLGEGDGPEWVRVLAFEELCQLHALEGDRGQALQVLHRGLSRFPDHPGLELLSLYLDTDRTGGSAELLAGLATGDRQPAGPGARARYDEWPTDINDTMLQLDRAVQARTPLLEAAVQQAVLRAAAEGITP